MSATVLRGYQTQLSNDAIESLRNHDRVVVVSPTGSGKTVTATQGIMPRLQGSVLWVTHRKELLRQAEVSGACDVQMIQSLRVHKQYDNVIIDEGHHVCADQYTALFEHFPNAKFIALTATPYRMDGVGLGSCGFTALVYGPDIYELTVQGYLCRCRVYVPSSESNESWSVGAACETLAEHGFTKALVYCRTVSDAQETARYLRDAKFRAMSVDSSTPTEEREWISKEFATGGLQVVSNHTIYTEGYDAPAIDVLVLNRHTQSRCLWRQMVGRGLRTAPGKRECLILDLASNGVTHGSIYDREIYTLSGAVDRVDRRTLPPSDQQDEQLYTYSTTQPLKEWKPTPTPKCLRESLAKLKSRSPLHRLLTASRA